MTSPDERCQQWSKEYIMTKTSEPPVISLPSGGGALRGLGEKFVPDLQKGTGTLVLPITLPDGRNGFQPNLALTYSTGQGNGPFGMGWSLGVPRISRKTSHGIPRYNAGDTFVLSGVDDLVALPKTSSPVAVSYRPRIEGAFARIERRAASGTDYWQVTQRDGVISRYGARGRDGKVEIVPAARVVDPQDSSRVFAWLLSETRDTFGNTITYEYEQLGHSSGGRQQRGEPYLTAVRYGDYGSQKEAKNLVEVRLKYGTRPDVLHHSRAGFEITTSMRCTAIEIWICAPTPVLSRAYQIEYADQLNKQGQRAPNAASLLAQVRLEGYDGAKTEALPPVTFEYSNFTPSGRTRGMQATSGKLPKQSLADDAFELVDLFANGLPSVMQLNGFRRYWRNVGGGRFEPAQSMPDAPPDVNLSNPNVQLTELDGDGRPNLLMTGGADTRFYSLGRNGWDSHRQVKYAYPLRVQLADPDVKLVDLDGDGVSDVIKIGATCELYYNQKKPYTWHREDVKEGVPNVSFRNPEIRLADMTGDGLQDIVQVRSGVVEYWPYLGRGHWGQPVSMANAPKFEQHADEQQGYQLDHVLLADVDGDGCTDIVYVSSDKVTIWINQAGNGWSAPIVVPNTPPVSDIRAVRMTDVLGEGIPGILYTYNYDETNNHGKKKDHYNFLDLTATKPYLLCKIDNNLGGVTTIEYAPSTQFYVADEQSRDTKWITPLPFPVHVVAKVSVFDAISGGRLTTEYSYHHGYWDGREREFRGFGRVDQRDSETFDDYYTARLHDPGTPFQPVAPQHFSPPTETRTWFHLGPVGEESGSWEEPDFTNEYWSGDPQVLLRPAAMTTFLDGLSGRVKRDALRALQGAILRSELYALDGTDRQNRPYTVKEHQWGVREESPPQPGEDRPRIFFPHALAERTTQWERGDDPMHHFEFTDGYDAYGFPESQLKIAVPRHRDFRRPGPAGDPYLATRTVTDRARRDDAQRYLVDRVARNTTYEILNDGSPALLDLRESVLGGTAATRIIGQDLHYYDGGALQGLPFGQIGDYGAQVRTERLVLTEDLLHAAYSDGMVDEPPYLVHDGQAAGTVDYPQGFRDALPAFAGYTFHAGAEFVSGYFAATERYRYDVHNGDGRGLVTVRRDPLGHDTLIAYDSFDLLPTSVSNAANLTTTAAYDYRVLRPAMIIDPNSNRVAYSYSPLGLLVAIAVMGKEGEDGGDTMVEPGTRFLYRLDPDTPGGQPISVRTVRRVCHATDKVPAAELNQTIEMIEYSDGFGRLLQTRMQAEDVLFGETTFGDSGLSVDPNVGQGETRGHKHAARAAPNVLVSGWQVYDNKGRVVERYEPFFSTGWAYAAPSEAQRGQKAVLHYDPRGHVIRTINPDGSEQRAIYGVPGTISSPILTNPEVFEPTPWEAYTYDADDNAGRTHPETSRGYQHQWNTPASVVVDALGRTVLTVERNRRLLPDASWAAVEEYRTRSTYDVRGNLLVLTDALNRMTRRRVYDLLDRPLRTESIDAGVRTSVLDAAGNLIECRDSKGSIALRQYDGLNRLVRLWACDGPGRPVTLRESLIYGDDRVHVGMYEAASVTANLQGRLYKHYDEAGLQIFERYDFKGNLLEKARLAVSDAAVAAGWTADWSASGAEAALDPMCYQTNTTYDALNRPVTITYPVDVTGRRAVLRPHYNRAGQLKQVDMDGAPYVRQMAYNARGQRALVAYGSGLMTRYAYAPDTFRLKRLRTERFADPPPASAIWTGLGPPLQDLTYGYDLVGNITTIEDRTPNSGIAGSPNGRDRLVRAFEYDPLYRLVRANGRVCKDIGVPRGLADLARCGACAVPYSGGLPVPNQDNAPELTERYVETYGYDPLGNLLELGYTAASGNWTRRFGMGGLPPEKWASAPNNRMTSLAQGAEVYSFTYDPNGNMTGQNTDRHYAWDHADRLVGFSVSSAGSPHASVEARYLYGADGMRVKKWVRTNGTGVGESTVYIDGVFEHHRWQQGGQLQENNWLHVMDGEQRIALVRAGPAHPDDAGPDILYHLGNHLYSSAVVVDAVGKWINREEYFPYGETSFGSFARKRYRFTGKERDEESGLGYYGARYISLGLAHWLSPDPLLISGHEKANGLPEASSPYAAFRSSPVVYVDPNGTTDISFFDRLRLAWAEWQTHLEAINWRNLVWQSRRIYGLIHNMPDVSQNVPGEVRSAEPTKRTTEEPRLGGERRPPPEKPRPVPSRTKGLPEGQRGSAQIKKPSQRPSPTPRQSMGPAFRQRGSTTVGMMGGLVRGGAGLLFWTWMGTRAEDFINAGFGFDLERREQYGDVFPLSSKQGKQLDELKEQREKESWDELMKVRQRENQEALVAWAKEEAERRGLPTFGYLMVLKEVYEARQEEVRRNQPTSIGPAHPWQ